MPWMQEEELKSALTDEQILAVMHKDGPALVSACPGAGKTRVVMYRTAMLVSQGVNPAHICLVTFTNKAAEEMKSRIVKLFGQLNLPGADRVYISTFHSLCAKLIREGKIVIPQGKKFSIYDEDDASDLIRSIAEEKYSKLDSAEAHSIHYAICDLRENKDPMLSDIETHMGENASIAMDFIEGMRAARALDFTGLLHEPYVSVMENKSNIGDIFRYVVVDEAQDTNFIQFELAKMLAPHGNLLLVGDGDQSIYKWRGARPENLVKFIDDGARLIRLTKNYRCNPHVVRAASSLISCDKKRINSDIHPVKTKGQPLSWKMFMDRDEEANWVATQIWKGVQSGMRASSIAVLIRANHLTRSFELAFNSRNIPYSVVGTRRFFDREEVRDALSILKFISNPKDAISLMRFLNKPRRGVGPKAAKFICDACARQNSIDAISTDILLSEAPSKVKDAVSSILEKISKSQSNINGSSLIDLMESMSYRTWLSTEHKDKADEKWENVKEFCKYIDESIGKGMSIDDVLEKAALANSKEESEDGVRILSMHSSKGLEFPNVFICCCEDGVIPHRRSIDENPENMDEERRLFYVAMTRAEDRLVLTFSIFDSKNYRLPKKPSRFLFEAEIVSTDELQEQFQELMSKRI
jgi:DNA helicase-2/ATP-dependent DNA helicase PcrA